MDMYRSDFFITGQLTKQELDKNYIKLHLSVRSGSNKFYKRFVVDSSYNFSCFQVKLNPLKIPFKGPYKFYSALSEILGYALKNICHKLIPRLPSNIREEHFSRRRTLLCRYLQPFCRKGAEVEFLDSIRYNLYFVPEQVVQRVVNRFSQARAFSMESTNEIIPHLLLSLTKSLKLLLLIPGEIPDYCKLHSVV